MSSYTGDSNNNKGSPIQVRAYDDPPNFTKRSNVGIESKLFSKNPSKVNPTEDHKDPDAEDEKSSHSSKDSDYVKVKTNEDSISSFQNISELKPESNSLPISQSYSDYEEEKNNKDQNSSIPNAFEPKPEPNSSFISQLYSDEPSHIKPDYVEISNPYIVPNNVIPESADIEKGEESPGILLKNEINIFSQEVYKLYQESYMNLNIPFEKERFETAINYFWDININKLD